MIDWQLGLQAFREGRMREAADRLRAALTENDLTTSQSVRYETYAFLGAALYALGRPGEAVPAFEMAFRFSPSTVPSEDLLMNLAHAYLAAGRPEAAREALLYILAYIPGHVPASMLLTRLDDAPADIPITGTVLGISPQTAEAYARTLTFSQPAAGGYAPAEVHEALNQLLRFIADLGDKLKQVELENAQYEAEILRYQQMEDAVVENMMQAQPAALTQGDTANADSSQKLSPIEILFRQQT